MISLGKVAIPFVLLLFFACAGEPGRDPKPSQRDAAQDTPSKDAATSDAHSDRDATASDAGVDGGNIDAALPDANGVDGGSDAGDTDAVDASADGGTMDAETQDVSVQDVGGGDSGGNDGSNGGFDAGAFDGSFGDGGVCPPPTDMCEACVSSACTQAYCDCFTNTECTDLISCVDACTPGDDACTRTCWTANESGISPAFLLGDCAGTLCNMSCTQGMALRPCDLCLFSSCPNEMNSCLANPDCAQLIQCLGNCSSGDQNCQNTCFGMFPNGAQNAGPVISCANTECPGVCPL